MAARRGEGGGADRRSRSAAQRGGQRPGRTRQSGTRDGDGARAAGGVRSPRARAGRPAPGSGQADRRDGCARHRAGGGGRGAEGQARSTRRGDPARRKGERRSADRECRGAVGRARGGRRAARDRGRRACRGRGAGRGARGPGGRGGAARNQEMRRIEMGRLSGERFECPPPLLPERAGFAEETVRGPQDESAAHDRLIAERERIGPVKPGRRDRAGRADRQRPEQRQGTRRADSGGAPAAREHRHAQSRGAPAAARCIRSGRPAFPATVHHAVQWRAGPSGTVRLTLLSGGEQALTAVALIFALFLTNPAPICVLDEVDAPLDDANIERFCDLLDAMTRETATRYLIVTHNAATMSRMHRLFGVTMVERGVSRLVSVDLGGAGVAARRRIAIVYARTERIG
ncbi:chromosome partition protein Smc [Ditylenchus destructor]|uniref:Chromosome partition protein Smc n=1 Tax=Ditylenchus destructor TaxID=166010 RepID=A0AAD4MLS4_9BILA|nr:chromosome partition protein Smc [Ditylenchus destructor]